MLPRTTDFRRLQMRLLKLVRDNDEKNCKFSNEFKNSFFPFFLL